MSLVGDAKRWHSGGFGEAEGFSNSGEFIFVVCVFWIRLWLFYLQKCSCSSSFEEFLLSLWMWQNMQSKGKTQRVLDPAFHFYEKLKDACINFRIQNRNYLTAPATETWQKKKYLFCDREWPGSNLNCIQHDPHKLSTKIKVWLHFYQFSKKAVMTLEKPSIFVSKCSTLNTCTPTHKHKHMHTFG